MTELPDAYDTFYQAQDQGALDAFTVDDPEIPAVEQDQITKPEGQ